MILRWTSAAQDDREGIIRYIAADNIHAALATERFFEEAPKRLIDYPKLGKPGEVTGTREFTVHENYRLIYEIDGDTILIISLIHVARQWPPLASD